MEKLRERGQWQGGIPASASLFMMAANREPGLTALARGEVALLLPSLSSSDLETIKRLGCVGSGLMGLAELST